MALPRDIVQAMALPPITLDSYTHLRETAGERRTGDLGLRRLYLNARQQRGADRVLLQLFFKDKNQANNDGRLYIHDASLTRTARGGTWTFGQFRPPFSLQQLTGDLAILPIDRAPATESLNPVGGMPFSFARDIGVQWEQKSAGPHALTLGAFRGSGSFQQTGVGMGGPLLMARLRHMRGNDRASERFGIVVSSRESLSRNFSRAFSGANVAGLNAFRGQDTRVGLETTLRHGVWLANGEFIDVSLKGRGPSPDLHARGGYVEVDYSVGGRDFVAAFQFLDPNTREVSASDTSSVTVGGDLVRHTKASDRYQLNYIWKRERRSEVANNVVQLQYLHYIK